MFVVHDVEHAETVARLEAYTAALEQKLASYRRLVRYLRDELTELELHPYKLHHRQTIPAEFKELLETINE